MCLFSFQINRIIRLHNVDLLFCKYLEKDNKRMEMFQVCADQHPQWRLQSEACKILVCQLLFQFVKTEQGVIKLRAVVSTSLCLQQLL